MLLLVFSDTHGQTAPMLRAIESMQPDGIVHLGDHDRDTLCLEQRFSQIPLFRVCGNCDLGSPLPVTARFSFGGVSFFATHGHRYRVKLEPDYDALCCAASLSGAQVALFGHTHIPVCRKEHNLWLLNPGSSGLGSHPHCGKIEILPSGEPRLSLLPL